MGSLFRNILLFVFFFIFIKTKPLVSWKHCYQEDASSKIIVTSAFASLTNEKRVDIHFNSTLTEPLQGGSYTVEIWYSGTGDKILYNGPYDICCGFKVNSTCSIQNSSESDCPFIDYFQVFVSKPLHKDYFGVYEATLKIFDLEKNELACVDMPFVHKSLKKDLESNDQNQISIPLKEEL